jgi:hypothetical protein
MLDACRSFRSSSALLSGCTTGNTSQGIFHAEHQGQQGKFDFSGEMTVGNIQSRTALRLIQEWAILHGTELQANWERMKAGQPLNRIAPLD